MRMLDVNVVTPAATLPVTSDEFVDHARLNALTVDNQPDLIARELAAATARAEQYLRRALITQTLDALFVPDGYTCRCSLVLRLPRPPISEVVSLTADGGVIDPATYTLDWGVITLSAPLAVPATVRYKAGYGDDAAAVPEMIREGILEYATVLYERRAGEREDKYVTMASRTVPPGVIDLWRPYQIEVSG